MRFISKKSFLAFPLFCFAASAFAVEAQNKIVAAKSSAKTVAKQTTKSLATSSASFITTAFDVNLREQPSVSANNLGQIRLGTILRSVERTPTKQTLGNREDYWHKIETAPGADGKSKKGWIFGGFLRSLPSSQRESVYREIADERVKAAGKNFSNNVELYEFLTRVQPAIKTPSAAAEIGLARLMALKTALAAVPFEKQSEPLYKNFTAAQDKNIVYSEPSGQFYVRSELFWALAKKYKNLPIGDQIAWAAAENPLPGECEGYLNCYLYLLKETYGNYLEIYPRGAHAAESLKSLGDYLQPIVADLPKKEIYTPPTEAAEKAEFFKTIAELRVVVSKTGFLQKDVVLRHLNQLAEGYK